MKRSQGFLIALIAAAGLALAASLSAQLLDSNGELISLASLQQVEAVPEEGTFYTLSKGDSEPPLPLNLFTNCPIYALSANEYLVDDSSINLGTFSLQSTDGGIMMLMEIDPPAPPDDEGGEDETNAPSITWPVDLQYLTLVASNDVPESGTFFLYTEQTNGNTPTPYPLNPLPECPVYSFEPLGITNVFLVYDVGAVWPEPDTNIVEYVYSAGASIIPGPNDLWLEITNVTDGFANLILHNSQSGMLYQIQTGTTPDGPWASELVVTGAVSQTSTPFSVVMAGRGSLFFRAHEGTDALGQIWIEITRVQDGVAYVDIHNTRSGYNYEIL